MFVSHWGEFPGFPVVPQASPSTPLPQQGPGARALVPFLCVPLSHSCKDVLLGRTIHFPEIHNHEGWGGFPPVPVPHSPCALQSPAAAGGSRGQGQGWCQSRPAAVEGWARVLLRAGKGSVWRGLGGARGRVWGGRESGRPRCCPVLGCTALQQCRHQSHVGAHEAVVGTDQPRGAAVQARLLREEWDGVRGRGDTRPPGSRAQLTSRPVSSR